MSDLSSIMQEHGCIPYSEIAKRKWRSFHDDILDQHVHFIDGFRESDNPNRNSIMIVRRSVKVHGWPKPRSEYTVVISCGVYGENGYEETFKPGISISFAKAKAAQAVKEAIENGAEFYDIATRRPA